MDEDTDNRGQHAEHVQGELSRTLRCHMVALAALAVSWALPIGAQTGSDPARPVHRAWRQQEGLPQNSVFAIEQTADGYLWVGTLQGLARFDGVRWRVFDSDSTPGLAGDRITKLYESGSGDLWIATASSGLSRYRRGEFRQFTPADGLPSLGSGPKGAFAEDHEGTLWVATDSGIARLVGERFEPVRERSGFPSGPVQAVSADADGVIWAGTASGVAHLEAGGWQTDTKSSGLLSNFVWSMTHGRDGTLWVGHPGGVSRRTENGWETLPIPGADVLCLYEDEAGRLLACASGVGLLAFDGSHFVPVDARLPSAVVAVLEDREGLLWVGTNGDGLHRLQAGLFGVPGGFRGSMTHAIYEDLGGSLWVGSWGAGLARIADGKVTWFGVSEGLPSAIVWAVSEDAEGALWVGTERGLAVYQDGRFVRMAASDHEGLLDDSVYSLARGRDGSLLIGTSNSSVSRYREGRFEALLTPEQMDGAVLTLLEDRTGALWVGTRGGGLGRLVAGDLSRYGRAEGLNENIRSLYEASDRELWVGTYGGGLCSVSEQRVRCLTRHHGLPDNTIHATLVDAQGQAWMSSNQGVFRVAASELVTFFAGDSDSVRVEQFTAADGMPSSECNGGFQPSALAARDGRLWFPTTEGPTVVNPQSAGDRGRVRPAVLFEEATVDGRLLERGIADPVVVPASGDRLVVSFTGLLYAASERLRFRYRLGGHDRDWIPAAGSRFATYTNLVPGTYLFEVEAMRGGFGSPGFASDPGPVRASLTVVVRPSVWQTPWFRAATGLLAILAVVAASRGILRRDYLRRLRQIKAEQALDQERMRISRDVHDEVGASLTEISILSEISRREVGDEGPTGARLVKIADSARAALDSISDIIWAIDPTNDRLDRLAGHLRESAARFLDSAGVIGVLEFPEQVESRVVPAQMRRDVARVMKEALRNAVRHGGPTRVQVELRIRNHELWLGVSDDGKGFDPDKRRSGGHGLGNMEHRARANGGTLGIDSGAGTGTRVRLWLPLPQSSRAS